MLIIYLESVSGYKTLKQQNEILVKILVVVS